MMLRQSLKYVFMALLLTGCVHHMPKTGLPLKSLHKTKAVSVPVVPLAHPIHQIRKMGTFSRVSVKGPFNVNLHTGAGQQRIILHGDAVDLDNVSTQVVSGQLYVTIGKGYPHYGPLTLDIYTHYLTSFTYDGSGTIIGHRLHTRALDLSIKNTGKTELDGHMVLNNVAIGGTGSAQISGINDGHLNVTVFDKARVQMTGMVNAASFSVKDEGSLSLYWVKSDSLRLRAKDKGFIQLAGMVVTRLEVELWGKAHFNGRYLRAGQSFIKTHQASLAEISTLRHQHTLATDRSNIYFYELPLSRADFMAFNGSVLDMQPWVHHYTEYND